MSGRSKHPLQTLLDGSHGVNRTRPLCGGCLYGRLRTCCKGTPPACPPLPPSTPVAVTSCDRGSLLTILLCSFRLLPEYNEFLSSLEKSPPLLCGSTPPATADENLDAVLEVLHKVQERTKAMADCDSTDDVGAPAVDQDENTIDGAG